MPLSLKESLSAFALCQTLSIKTSNTGNGHLQRRDPETLPEGSASGELGSRSGGEAWAWGVVSPWKFIKDLLTCNKSLYKSAEHNQMSASHLKNIKDRSKSFEKPTKRQQPTKPHRHSHRDCDYQREKGG